MNSYHNQISLSEFYQLKSGVGLMWMGNDGWVLNMYGAIISTDLDLDSPNRVPLPHGVDIRAMAGHIQAAFVTHAHGDHFNAETCRMFARHSDCLFVIPKSCARKAAETGLPPERLVSVEPGADCRVADIGVRVVRAVHGHYMGSVYSGASLLDCGYIFERNGFRAYQPGDTVLLEEHFDMRGIDLAFVSPTEHNMHVENAARYLSLLSPRYIVPQHYDSYIVTDENAFWTRGYVDELYERLPDAQKARFIRMTQGAPATLSV